MARLYNTFWVGVTVVLTVVFVVMFFPMVQAKYGVPTSILLTALGVIVIWLSYLVRAYIFTRGTDDSPGKRGRR